MVNDDQFVGLTLLLKETQIDGEYAVLLSFSRPCKSPSDAIKIGKKLGNEIATMAEHPTEYIGIADLFAVSGPASMGAILGRTSIPEWKLVEEVFSAQESVDMLTLQQEQEQGCKNYTVELGYIERTLGAEPKGLTVVTIVRSGALGDATKVAESLANEFAFKESIVKLGMHQNGIYELEFVCVLSIARTFDDAHIGGVFQNLVCPLDRLDSDLDDELLHNDDLYRHFEL